MATKREKQIVSIIGLGLAGCALWTLTRGSKSETGGYGAPTRSGFAGYGDATSAAQWYPSTQYQVGPRVGMYAPLGPILEHPGYDCARAHPGLSHTQWMQLYMKRIYGVAPLVDPTVVPALIGSDPGAVGDTGYFGAYGEGR